MTRIGRPVSEDDLHAYVDGFLDSDDRARVELYLCENPEAAARVQGWQQSGIDLRRALSHKALEPVPSSLNLTRLAERLAARRWLPRHVAASVLLALALGAGAGWMVRGSDAPTGLAALGMQAAMVQRAFASDGLHPVEFDAAQGGQLATWTGQRLGRPLSAPDLSRAGFKLLGGRLVATESGPGCVFMYDGENGQRITVLVRRMETEDKTTSIQPVKGRGATGFGWMTGGLAYGVMASTPLPTLRDVSDQVFVDMKLGA